MKNNDYTRTIEVEAAPAEAFAKISTVTGWWAKKVIGKSGKLHDEFTVDFGETFVTFRISELAFPEKLVWTVIDCNLDWISNKKEWNGSSVIFRLAPQGKKTIIHFTHVGLVPAAECYSACEAGWNEHITQGLVPFINEHPATPVTPNSSGQ